VPDSAADTLPLPLRAAVVLVVLEALALLGLAALLTVKTAVDHPNDVAGALLGAAMALVAAVVLGLCARGLAQGRPAARTPVVVIQLLCIPVSYSLGFQAHRLGYGGPIFVAALAVLYLLFTPPARAVLDRQRDL
jgi:hypothetical protein